MQIDMMLSQVQFDATDWDAAEDELMAGRIKCFELTDKLKDSRHKFEDIYQRLGSTNYQGKYVVDDKTGKIKLVNSYEKVGTAKPWQNQVPGYETMNFLDQLDYVKDLQKGLLDKMEGLNR